MGYDTLKKFAEKKGIVTAKSAEKDIYKASKKGKALTTKEQTDLLLMMAKNLGYLE